MINIEYYLIVSTIMMFAGVYGFFTRRNLLAILISVELILNSVDINFAVFNRFLFCHVRHRCQCRRNGCCNCDYYKHIS